MSNEGQGDVCTVREKNPVTRIPTIMVAPNGARRGKEDHPALPITISETAQAVVACYRAGAGAAHLHVRDREGRHVLDAGLYRELMAEIASEAPAMTLQVTTESVGLYQSSEQQALVRALLPAHVSVALREIREGESDRSLRAFFHWANEAGIQLQHILYAPEEVEALADLVQRGIVPAERLETLFVLGRYSKGQTSEPEDIDPFLARKAAAGLEAGWAVCAFGARETECLLRAVDLGGKARIGFENNFFNRDGTRAQDNAERVAELVGALRTRRGDLCAAQ